MFQPFSSSSVLFVSRATTTTPVSPSTKVQQFSSVVKLSFLHCFIVLNNVIRTYFYLLNYLSQSQICAGDVPQKDTQGNVLDRRHTHTHTHRGGFHIMKMFFMITWAQRNKFMMSWQELGYILCCSLERRNLVFRAGSYHILFFTLMIPEAKCTTSSAQLYQDAEWLSSFTT